MNRGLTGKQVSISTGGETYSTFMPFNLPPAPPLEWNAVLQEHLTSAGLALGRLDGMVSLLPDASLFLYSYIRKEAVLSSQIEGTQSSLSDLMLFENEKAAGVPFDDVQEVSNYVAAMNEGLKRIKEGFPISLRLVREIHKTLLSKGRGIEKEPGEFRRSQNWIGGSRPGNALFVPPSPEDLMECLGAWENFLHSKTPALIKAALMHVQFETIHPFLDGNGRVGRLLITLLLCAEGVLTQPLLYLSLFFKQHRSRYYDLLQKIRLEGDWESWLEFFLTGVEETSQQAVATAHKLRSLFSEDMEKIKALARSKASSLELHRYLQTHPITSIHKASEVLKISIPTLNLTMKHLEKLGIVGEITGRQRDRIFAYQKYIRILNEENELPTS